MKFFLNRQTRNTIPSPVGRNARHTLSEAWVGSPPWSPVLSLAPAIIRGKLLFTKIVSRLSDTQTINMPSLSIDSFSERIFQPMIVYFFSPIIAVGSQTNNKFWATFVFLYIYSIICCSAALKLQSLGNLKNLLNIEFSLKHKHQILSGPLPTKESPAHYFFHVSFRKKLVAIFHQPPWT